MNNRIPPIPMMLHIIGNIPTSYAMAMSYEEQLLCLKNYLCEIVVPTMNENIEEIQTLITYINNYFDNLDLQEEVNTKIEEMVESGELQEIITSYLQMKGVLGFDTLNNMVEATNIIEGSICRTIGNLTYNDGKGAYYKIRQITSSDVVDGVHIIALNISETLIAELIEDYNINQINENLSTIEENIDSIENDIEDINSTLNIETSERTILIGDSYSVYRPNIEGIEGWAVPLRRLLNLENNDCPIIQDNGGGFTQQGSTGTFLEGLQNLNVQHKNTIKRIVVCGGLNDYNSTPSDIKSAISTFVTYCNTNFPNAKVYIGMIDWETDNFEGTTDNAQYGRYRVLNNVLPAYQECNEYGAIYLNGVENVMRDYTNYYDISHPNQNLCLKLAYYIYQALQNGYASITYPQHKLAFKSDYVDNTNFAVYERIVNNNFVAFDLMENGSIITFTSGTHTINSNKLYVGRIDSNYFRSVNTNDIMFSCPAIITDTNNQKYQANASFYILYLDYLYMRVTSPSINDGLNVKSITLLSPYLSKPAVIQ